MQQLKESSKNSKPLLSQPIHRMMDELDEEISAQKQEAIDRLEYDDYDDTELITENNKDSNERLWVDKYRPKKYTDLMGDEVRN
jgi:chromosome transmission fidelity protein 18